MVVTLRQALLAGLGIVAGTGVVRQVPATGIPPIGSPYPIDKDGGFIVPQRMRLMIPMRVVRADGVYCRHPGRGVRLPAGKQV